MRPERMHVVERGTGAPLVLVPGVQGRWEYMRPAIERLAEHFRVVTFSLAGERRSGCSHDPRRGLDDLVEQMDAVMDLQGLRSAIICGVSFGGLVALRYAAICPDRTRALVLASTPAPGWHLRRRHEIYARLPWVFGPVFLAETPWRMRAELRAALPNAADRRRFKRQQLRTLLEAPISVSRMAMRARLIGRIDAESLCRAITRPTLVLTGEPGLDHVINGDGGSSYARLITTAEGRVLAGTGHLGLVTRPGDFADAIKTFADGCGVGAHETEDDAA
ncbi:MAG: alpha/beta fold hydrolase [Vicinamibacterales bacterium]